MENYEVTSVLGAGAFGTCYRVRNRLNSLEYVWRAMNDQDMHEVMIAYIDSRTAPDHPNLVKYYECIVHEQSRTVYVVSDYFSSNLKHFLRTKSEHPEEKFIWKVIYQVSSALKDHDVVINIDNIFLDNDGNIKIDIGLRNVFNVTVRQSALYSLGLLIYDICTLCKDNSIEQHELPEMYSNDLKNVLKYLLLNKSSDNLIMILQHPTVLMKCEQFINDRKVENVIRNSNNKKLENIRNREHVLKIREERLAEKEHNLAKREKKVLIMERMAKEKLSRAELYLRQSKIKSGEKRKIKVCKDDLDTSYSADPGDSSFLPTSSKINEDELAKPKQFVRSKSERRVHFNAQRVFENNPEMVLKEYRFFDNSEPENEDKKVRKSKKFGFLRSLNSKISMSNSSLGSKSSNETKSSEGVSSLKNQEVKLQRPISWTEENKKCAFTLLKLMNAENNKENIQTKAVHTKM